MSQPLFIPPGSHIANILGIQGVDSAGSKAAQLDVAISSARGTFFRALGSARIAAIVGYAHTESPSTDNEYIRSIAEDTEIKLIKRELMGYYQSMYLEGSGGGSEAWNEDGLLRQFEPSELKGAIEYLSTDIDKNLSLLSGESSFGAESNVRSFSVEPDIAHLPPGATIWPDAARALWP